MEKVFINAIEIVYSGFPEIKERVPSIGSKHQKKSLFNLDKSSVDSSESHPNFGVSFLKKSNKYLLISISAFVTG